MMKYLPLFTAIEHLLETNECVIIPNLGAFKIQHSPAERKLQYNEVQPPLAILTFDSEIKHNDGLLLNYLYETQGVSEKTCALLLEKWVEGIRADLMNQSTFTFPNLGTLNMKDVGVFEFEPIDKNFNINTAHLPTLHNLNPVARHYHQEQIVNAQAMDFVSPEPIIETAEEEIYSIENEALESEIFSENDNTIVIENNTINQVEEIEKEENTILPFPKENTITTVEVVENTATTIVENIANEQQNTENNVHNIAENEKKSNKALFIILGIILALILILLLWWTVSKNKAKNTDEKVLEKTEELLPIDTSSNLLKEDSVDTTVVDDNKDFDLPISNNNTLNNNSYDVANQSNAKTYIVVIGAFAEQKYVDRSLKLLKKAGYTPNLVTTGKGLQRVGVEITCSQEELKLHLKDIRRKFHPEAWVVKD